MIPGLQEAISRLAALFEYGELQAETLPVAFVNDVAYEVVRLRADRDQASADHEHVAHELARVAAERDEARGLFLTVVEPLRAQLAALEERVEKAIRRGEATDALLTVAETRATELRADLAKAVEEREVLRAQNDEMKVMLALRLPVAEGKTDAALAELAKLESIVAALRARAGEPTP